MIGKRATRSPQRSRQVRAHQPQHEQQSEPQQQQQSEQQHQSEQRTMLQPLGAPMMRSPTRAPLLRCTESTESPVNTNAAVANVHCALVVTQQPPLKWYKDQFGRKATFEVRLRRVGAGCAACIEQRHLAVQLLYENGKIVENQTILRISSGLCLSKENESTVAIRIMEVSKNHQNQSGWTPAPVVTDGVLVLSKKNKRPAKSEGEEMMDGTPSKPKRCRADDSPVLSARRAVSSPRHHVQASSPMRTEPMADEFSETMPDASSWASMQVRFKTSSESVCLWANAAYTFLHKLQWQRAAGADAAAGDDDDMDAFLSHASLTPYQCPVCRESYGATPKHRSDCDLSLLLQQSGSFDSSPLKKKRQTPPTQTPPARSNERAPFKPSAAQSLRFALTPASAAMATPPPKSSAAAVATAHRPTASGPSKLSLTQDLLQFSESPSGDAKPATALASSSLDALAKNLNLNSWEGYSVLSRFMFSTLDMEGTSSSAAPASLQGKPLVLPTSAPLLRPDALATALQLQGVPPVRDAPPPAPPSSFSKLIASMKDIPADAAAFLQEQDAELNGDASLLCSLSRVSLSDFLNSESAASVQKVDPRYVATLSSLLADDVAKSPATSEDAVAFIVATDFRHCGYPAFDDALSLLGFYFRSGSAAQANWDLRFMPNFYPLPPEMLQELEQSVSEWRGDSTLMFGRRSASGLVQSLAQLKQQVLERLATM